MGTRLSEDEVQRALDFCVHLFSPTTPEQHEAVRRKLSEAVLPEESSEHEDEDRGRTRAEPTDTQATRGLAERLMDVRAPIVDPSALAKLIRSKLSLFRRSSSTSVSSVSSHLSLLSTSSLPSAGASSAPSTPVSEIFSMGTSTSTSSRARSVSSASEGDDEGDDDEVKMVLDKVNARRVIHAEHGEGLNSLEQEALGGLVVRLVRGQLGLVSADAKGEH